MSQPLWDPSADPVLYLRVTDLKTLLRDRGLGLGVEVYDTQPGLPLPADPNAMLCITILPGFGPNTEGVIDHQQFQVRTVGPQGDADLAQELAVRVDKALIPVQGQNSPLQLNGLHVLEISRTGGPQHLLRDAENRHHYVCTYSIQIEAYGG